MTKEELAKALIVTAEVIGHDIRRAGIDRKPSNKINRSSPRYCCRDQAAIGGRAPRQITWVPSDFLTATCWWAE